MRALRSRRGFRRGEVSDGGLDALERARRCDRVHPRRTVRQTVCALVHAVVEATRGLDGAAVFALAVRVRAVHGAVVQHGAEVPGARHRRAKGGCVFCRRAAETAVCVDGVLILQAQGLQNPGVQRRRGSHLVGRAELQREVTAGPLDLAALQQPTDLQEVSLVMQSSLPVTHVCASVPREKPLHENEEPTN